jgi:hypothetical protein
MPNACPYSRRIADRNVSGQGELVHVAHCGTRSAVVRDEDVLLLDWPPTGNPKVVYSRRLGWRTSTVGISQSGRYVLVRSADELRLCVLDTQRDAFVGEIASADGKRKPVGVLATAGDTEVLLASCGRMKLSAHRLGDMSQLFEHDFAQPLALIFEHVYPVMPDGDTLLVLGYLYSESKDSLYSFSFAQLAADTPASGPHRMRGQRELADYAYRLAAGPCGNEAAVIFRDSDDEVAGEAESAPDPSEPLAELWGFRGFYVRRLADNQIVERVHIDVPLEKRAAIFATSAHVVAACPDMLAVVPRQRDITGVTRIAARSCGVDANGASVALITPAGELELLAFDARESRGAPSAPD